MAIGDDESTGTASAELDTDAMSSSRDDGDVGWEWERDLEAQGHGGCWERSHLEAGFDDDEESLRNRCASPSRRRTDVRIYEEVCALLSDHPLLDARAIEVEVARAGVTLRGAVCSAAEIDVCRKLLEHVSGIERADVFVTVVTPRVHAADGAGDGADGADGADAGDVDASSGAGAGEDRNAGARGGEEHRHGPGR